MANIQEALVATLFDQSDAIADVVLHHNPVLSALEEKGNVERKSGGYEFRKPVMYNDSAVGSWYGVILRSISQRLMILRRSSLQLSKPMSL